MLPIVRLVRDRVAASGLPLRSFADARGISYSTLRAYHDPKLKPLKQPPRQETIRTLANALDVLVSEVERAADASVGRLYRQDSGPDLSVFFANINDLGTEDQAAAKARILAFLDEMGED